MRVSKTGRISNVDIYIYIGIGILEAMGVVPKAVSVGVNASLALGLSFTAMQCNAMQPSRLASRATVLTWIFG